MLDSTESDLGCLLIGTSFVGAQVARSVSENYRDEVELITNPKKTCISNDSVDS